MTQFTWNELETVTGGTWLLPPPARGTGISEIEMDSRLVQAGQLFLAFKGETHDSHDFAEQAAKQDAAVICIDRELSADVLATLREAACGCLRVANTLTAYQELARHHRRRFPRLTMIAITGSCGKTSTKEIVAAVARAHFGKESVLATEGNTNNLIGAPRNLLRLGEQHLAAVLEVGTNAPGEIAALTRLVEPDIAILTNVGPVHLEGLGNLDGVRREKACIFGTLGEAGRAIVAHELRHEPLISERLPAGRVTSVGPQAEADFRLVYRGGSYTGSSFSVVDQAGHELVVTWPLMGEHQAQNGGVAVAVARLLGLDDAAIPGALAHVKLPGMRMSIHEQDGVRWVNDAYNANPASMRAVIDWLASIEEEAGTLYLCLGDMLELGPGGLAHHGDVLDYAAEHLPKAVIVAIGPLMAEAAQARGLSVHGSLQEARTSLHSQIEAGDTVVLKGSRGMRLEGLLPSSS